MPKQNSIFQTGKPNPRLAKAISIKSPDAFRKSIRELSKDGMTTKEFRALQLAQNRAVAQLNRKDLSLKEIKEMSIIGSIKIPKPTK